MKSKLTGCLFYVLKDFYGEDYNLVPIIHRYASNNTLAIELVIDDTGECFDTLTVNIAGSDSNNEDEAYVDINNCPWALAFIQDNDLGKPTGMYGFSGYCCYPQYKFDLSKLNESVGGDDNA